MNILRRAIILCLRRKYEIHFSKIVLEILKKLGNLMLFWEIKAIEINSDAVGYGIWKNIE